MRFIFSRGRLKIAPTLFDVKSKHSGCTIAVEERAESWPILMPLGTSVFCKFEQFAVIESGRAYYDAQNGPSIQDLAAQLWRHFRGCVGGLEYLHPGGPFRHYYGAQTQNIHSDEYFGFGHEYFGFGALYGPHCLTFIKFRTRARIGRALYGAQNGPSIQELLVQL